MAVRGTLRKPFFTTTGTGGGEEMLIVQISSAARSVTRRTASMRPFSVGGRKASSYSSIARRAELPGGGSPDPAARGSPCSPPR